MHPNGKLEAPSMFKKRRYCSVDCKRVAKAVVPPSLLVAQTCIGCHRLLPRDDYRVASGRRASRCRDCTNAADRQDDERKARAAERERERGRALKEASSRTASRAGERWTSEEVAVLLDDGLTVLEKATRLRRTYRAVLQAIPEARAGRLVKEVVAAEIPHGTVEGQTYWRCRCEACKAAAAEARRKYRSAAQARTLPTARRRGQVWTGAEMELLATRVGPDDLSIVEVAELLGRSYSATNLRRQKIMTDPKWMRAAGVLDA